MPARSSYHRGVVAEAIANMLAHRDLALRDLPSRVHVFDHSLGVCEFASQCWLFAGGAKGDSLWHARTFESTIGGGADEFCVWIETQPARVAGVTARGETILEPQGGDRFV